ncbi:MAG: chemotaxis protein CheX [Planctomycetota bacterium]
MQAEYINPFVRSVIDTFSTMVECDARRGELGLDKQGPRPYPVSGVIGLSGRAAGTVVINLSEEVALKVASTMLMTEYTEVDADVVDAVGELANVVAGGAKAELEEFALSVSLPNVVTGVGHEVRFPSNTTPIAVPFDTDFGPFELQVGFEAVEEPLTTC